MVFVVQNRYPARSTIKKAPTSVYSYVDYQMLSNDSNDSYREVAECRLNNKTSIFTSRLYKSNQKPLRIRCDDPQITSEADGSKSRPVHIYRRLLRQEVIERVGQTRQFVKPEQHPFPKRHLFPRERFFSALRFLMRLLRRFIERGTIDTIQRSYH